MRAVKIAPNAFPLLFALALGAVHSQKARAQEPHTFIIAAAGGYGVEDCLGDGGECGKIVADAWCESHGGGAALKFGRESNGDGALSQASMPLPKPYFITCGD
jgi:hypothetical protein